MIHVDRTKVPVPKIFKSKVCEDLKAQAKEFYSIPNRKRAQLRHEFHLEKIGGYEERHSLLDLFEGKCAYCDLKLYARNENWDIDHFRPVRAAINLRGEESYDHYFWFAYDWANLYPVCLKCGSAKKNHFPVFGRRAKLNTSLAEINSHENHLLLDPCRDYPQAELVFYSNGRVYSTKSISNLQAAPARDRGFITIETLGLNRKDLVSRRLERCSELQLYVRDNYLSRSLGPFNMVKWSADTIERRFMVPDWSVELLKRYEDPQLEFLALQRQIIFRMLWEQQHSETTKGINEKEIESVMMALIKVDPHSTKFPNLTQDDISRASDYRQRGRKILRGLRLGIPAQPESRKRRTAKVEQHIEEVEIVNFKGIKKLNFSTKHVLNESVTFIPSTSKDIGWRVLLGENGLGKSSILQAITLALAGKTRLDRMVLVSENNLKPDSVLRRGCQNGFVRVKLNLEDESRILDLKKDKLEYRDQHSRTGFGGTFCAYSIFRMALKKDKSMPSSKTYPFNVDNLFNPFTPLLNVDKWLLSLSGREFVAVASVIRTLLEVPQTAIQNNKGSYLIGELRRSPKKKLVSVRMEDGVIPLSSLSDGYFSVITLACDIMRTAGVKHYQMQEAEGIVFIDEIGSNLHPRWKMKIVSSLRKAFPNIQFIVTTHDPLCLRGVRKGETAILFNKAEPGKKDISIRVDVPDPAGLRVDQLLTSQYFGLDSTVDPDLQRSYDTYYSLLAIEESKRKPAQRKQIEKLQEELKGSTILGSTWRDQLILEWTD